jgi:large subunit ribosomal protein L13
MKTYAAKPQDIDRKWHVVDAEGVVLGRLASAIAMRLKGKHKPMYSPHLDCGDYIVVINADKIALTGAKYAKKVYYRHTGHPGGIKDETAREVLEGEFPERVLMRAVKRMLAKGPMGREQLKKLRLFNGSEHTHDAQQPAAWDFKNENPKNVRRR